MTIAPVAAAGSPARSPAAPPPVAVPEDDEGHIITIGDSFDPTKPLDAPKEPWYKVIWADVMGTLTYPKLLLFPDIKKNAVLRGRVVSMSDGRTGDSDVLINVEPDAQCRDMLRFRGKPRPYIVKDRFGNRYEAIHNEIPWLYQSKLMPKVRELIRLIKTGHSPRVETRGTLTYDCLHQGWVEMHPVKSLKILAPDSPAVDAGANR